jgi:hypothetical protein
MRKAYLFIAAVGFCFRHPRPFLRMDFFADWFNMVSETQAEEHHRIPPLNTTTPRLRTGVSV